METCREYSFSGYIDISNGEEVFVEGDGWISEDGVFWWVTKSGPGMLDTSNYRDQIFELFQIKNRGRLPHVCIDRFESAPLAYREPNHNQNSAIGR